MSEPSTNVQDGQSPEEEEQEQRARDEAMLNNHITMLSEHFEAVQIFVTRPTRTGDGQTASFALGRGNWFARRGMVEDWRVASNARTAADAITPDDDR